MIVNAIKYTEQGSITISIQKTMSRVKILVTDTGSGIENFKQNKIFQIFGNMKFKQSINSGGAGIGLSLCKELCGLLDAEISF